MNTFQIMGKVSDENKYAYYIQDEANTTYELAKDLVVSPIEVGDSILGFGYIDRDNRAKFIIDLPPIITEGFGWGRVVGRRPNLGLFIDVGLPNKDIVISLDELSDNIAKWPELDAKLLVQMSIDERQRYWAHLLKANDIEQYRKSAPKRLMNQSLQVTLFEDKGVGMVGLSQENFEVFIHESEQLDPLKLGQVVEARVIKVHPNGKLNASTRPRAFEALEDDAQMIQAVLEKQPNQFLPLHDKSPSDEIQRQLDLSKSQFKRAVGRLMKADIVTQVRQEGIYLKTSGDNQ